jgi:serine/threonine-protein kinase HipA
LFQRGGEENLDQLRQWLSVLVAPGASLGGAHPKANFRQVGGALWIAKFPAGDDVRNNALWEKVVHDMARDAHIIVPESELQKFGSGHHTFCVQRFDRTQNGARTFFISAMTALGVDDGTEGSYLDLAMFIQNQGVDDRTIKAQLAQLFRRVVFNAQVGNRDDHLRNHGFVFEDRNWNLSPAYDLNPSFDKQEHVLSFDGTSHAPNMDVILETAEYYRLEKSEATAILKEVSDITDSWRVRAKAIGLSSVDIQEASHILP